MKLTGRVTLVHMRQGRVLSIQRGKNLVVNAGRQLIAKIFDTNDGSYPTPEYISLGTGTAVVTASDTALGAESTNCPSGGNRTHATVVNYFNYRVTWSATISKDAGAAETIGEAGIFNAAAYGTGTMLARFLPQPFILENGDSVYVYWDLTFGD